MNTKSNSKGKVIDIIIGDGGSEGFMPGSGSAGFIGGKDFLTCGDEEEYGI